MPSTAYFIPLLDRNIVFRSNPRSPLFPLLSGRRYRKIIVGSRVAMEIGKITDAS